MRKRLIPLAIFLIAGFFLLKAKKEAVTTTSDHPQEVLESPTPTPPSLSAKKPPTEASPTEFRETFQREVRLSSRLDEHPEETERRLNLMAAKLRSEDQRFLKEIVLDTNAGGDDRAVAEEILGRSTAPSTPSLLEEIASRDWGSLKDPQRSDFERALSARAIEQLGTHPSAAAENSLKTLTQTLNDSFLVDRAHRALLARSGQVAPPEKQDLEALQALTPSGPHPHH